MCTDSKRGNKWRRAAKMALARQPRLSEDALRVRFGESGHEGFLAGVGAQDGAGMPPVDAAGEMISLS